MLYTLLKFLGWGALLAFIGGCIGWALRALKCRGEIARANSATVDVDEVERMRHRLANLEQVVAERDRLRIQLADVRHADSPGIVGAEVPQPLPTEQPPESAPEQKADGDAAADASAEIDAPGEATVTDEVTVTDEATQDEAPSIASDTDAGETGADDTNAAPADGSSSVAGFADATGREPIADEPTADDPVDAIVLDLDAAASVLGKKIELDDLTVVEGIGPKISELCSGIGLATWRQLADVDVADLQSMLDAAGSRYTVHKPGTWPRQAELLAAGRWTDFKTFTDELDGGK